MKLTVGQLTEKSTVLAGSAGLEREITSPQVNTADLSAAGSWRDMSSSVIHLPPSQLLHLASLGMKERLQLVRAILRQKPACIVLSGGTVVPELLRQADSATIPVFRTRSIPKVVRLLAEMLEPKINLHGVLVQIFGLGTLIIGESGIGKSEAALDLVIRGHKLAADDLVMLEKTEAGISGHATDMGADFLQIRGLGIVNMRALYGESATTGSCRIGLVVELEEWKKGQQYTLVGLRERRYKLLGVSLPYLKLPVKMGRNMATLIEVAARNQILKNRGIFTARNLQQKLMKRLAL